MISYLNSAAPNTMRRLGFETYRELFERLIQEQNFWDKIYPALSLYDIHLTGLYAQTRTEAATFLRNYSLYLTRRYSLFPSEGREEVKIRMKEFIGKYIETGAYKEIVDIYKDLMS